MKKLQLLLVFILLFAAYSCSSDDDCPEAPPKETTNTFNVKDFGAIGDEKEDDAIYIQAAIDKCESIGGGYVLIPKGNYKLTEKIVLKSKVNLKFEADAKFLRYHDWYMFVTTPDPKIVVKSFDAASNFSIEGGTFDMRSAVLRNARSCIVLTHSENISLNNITVLDCINETHAIDITGSRNILIENSTFSGKQYIPLKENETFSPYAEAIQIDLAKPGSTSAIEGESYDYTVTENVVIRGCTFKDGWARAVGSHSSTYDIFYNNIIIDNNKMTGLIDYAISALKCKNWIIKNNKITDCEGGIRFKNSEAAHSTPQGQESDLSTAKLQGNYNNTVTENIITNTGSKHAIQFYGKANTSDNYGEGRSSGGFVTNNTINNVGGNGIDMNRSDDIIISGNTISNHKKDAIKIYANCKYIIEKDNTIK